jgi:glycosyltransferase involved in cell wall biosynthesis
MPTTVLVDAWHLGGHSANRGIGTYLRGILPILGGTPGLDLVGLAEDETVLPDGVRFRRIRRWAPGRFAQREHELRLPIDLARAARAADADVVFSPADDPPARCRRPWVQMLHDLIPLVVDDPAMAGPAQRWKRIGPRLRDADAVCTNSRCSADDAVRLLGVDPDRIHVIPLGVDPRYRPADQDAQPREGPPTILYVGEYGPHKGFAEAFAVAAAVAEAGLPHRLAMVGYLAPWYEPTVRGLLAASPRPDRVDLLGYVDDIVATYQQADALIVTSRYEGFCLPVLEAMACGTPVVAFANSALPEVVADAGILVERRDVDAFAEALVGLLRDPSAQRAAVTRGLAHARSFTWERCASAHAKVLTSVARSR